jgi:hypothetical protein
LGDSFGAAIVEHYSKKELEAPASPQITTNGHKIQPFQFDDNANGLKGTDNATFADDRV